MATWASIWLCLATFVTFLSAKLIAPILPILAAQLGAEDLSLASVSGAYVVFLALFQIFTGAFADRFGRRRTIALGSSIAAFSSLLCVFARSWEQLLILRALGGAADAFMDLGLVIGPAFCFTTLAISRWTIDYSFPLMAAPSLLALGLTFKLKETKA